MTALANPIVCTRNPRIHSLNGSSLKPVDQFIGNGSPRSLTLIPIHQRREKLSARRRPLTVQAAYSDGGKPSGASVFIGGFVFGGIVLGTLGCVYAPQISKALAGADKKDLMRKLPKFIYDEEKALEKTRKILAEKIAQLNSAIDGVSAQLHAEDTSNGAVTADEIEATV